MHILISLGFLVAMASGMAVLVALAAIIRSALPHVAEASGPFGLVARTGLTALPAAVGYLLAANQDLTALYIAGFVLAGLLLGAGVDRVALLVWRWQERRRQERTPR